MSFDIPQIGKNVVKYIGKYPGKIDELAVGIGKKFPNEAEAISRYVLKSDALSLEQRIKFASKLYYGYDFSYHAIQRIAQRNIDVLKVFDILRNTKPFEYFHEGVMKRGYYDKSSKVFIGQIKSSRTITTVIDNVEQSYINNLLKTIK